MVGEDCSFDSYVFVTPEYNHATSGALKKAIDFLHNEWINKATGFIGYGGMSRVKFSQLISTHRNVASPSLALGRK